MGSDIFLKNPRTRHWWRGCLGVSTFSCPSAPSRKDCRQATVAAVRSQTSDRRRDEEKEHIWSAC